MKTLKQLLKELISSSDISGAFDEDGVLTDIYASKKAERDIACWYLADGELLAEATAGNEKFLAHVLSTEGGGGFGNAIESMCRFEAMKWAKANEWDFVKRELTLDYNAKPETDDTPMSFKEMTFMALDPTRQEIGNDSDR